MSIILTSNVSFLFRAPINISMIDIVEMYKEHSWSKEFIDHCVITRTKSMITSVSISALAISSDIIYPRPPGEVLWEM